MATEEEWSREAQDAKKLASELREDARKLIEKASQQDVRALTCERNAAEAKLYKYQQNLAQGKSTKTAPIPLTERQKKELVFLRKMEWSDWPLISMKRAKIGQWPEKATLCGWDRSSIPTNYSLYREPLSDLKKLYNEQRMDQATRSRIFGSLEDMISEGWEVDGADALVIQRGA